MQFEPPKTLPGLKKTKNRSKNYYYYYYYYYYCYYYYLVWKETGI